MKKILTAIGNPDLNENLKQIADFEIVANDIQYQDGIFEIIEENNIDILILSELLKGENSLEQLIKKIKEKDENIKIILLLEKEDEKKLKMAEEEKIEKILFHHKVTIQEMIKILKDVSEKNNIEEEIQNLKKLILENNSKNKTRDKLYINLKGIINNRKTEDEKINKKIITVAGSYGVGKSIISTCMAICLSNLKYKTAIIDFDLINRSVNTILGEKTFYSKKLKDNYWHIKNNYNEIKINKYLNYFCGTNIINNENDTKSINHFFDDMKSEYKFIINDISSNINLNFTKLIFQKSDFILFLVEGNLIEIKKSINLLNTFIHEWKIEKNKINVVFNKYNKNSIDEKILKNIFSEFNILGKISYSKNYSLIINKNMKNYFLFRKEKKEQKTIINSILKK